MYRHFADGTTTPIRNNQWHASLHPGESVGSTGAWSTRSLVNDPRDFVPAVKRRCQSILKLNSVQFELNVGSLSIHHFSQTMPSLG
jgi:hypothetical protein